ncbi:hypothetical protein [Saccharothrix sp. NRRL B-16314]|uniref:hypothetical protein n=1 Tax=Saccharothrix sp. NRRL B-16314 TaxID=1463825 RepID=UPI0005261B0E|nr:hypothetical protein [Saccharothrix sp. NRRL B-16314]
MAEPLLLSIAASLASRAVAGLYELVRAKFADDPVATAALTAADGAPADSPEVRALGEVLERTAEADPEFGARLRAHTTVTQTGRVNNQISAPLQGGTVQVVQAGDIKGDITFR